MKRIQIKSILNGKEDMSFRCTKCKTKAHARKGSLHAKATCGSPDANMRRADDNRVHGIWDDMGGDQSPNNIITERRPRGKEPKMIAKKQKPSAEAIMPILFPGQETTPTQLDVATDVLRNAQPKSGRKLHEQWEPMFRPMKQFLSSIGCDFSQMRQGALHIACVPVPKDGHHPCGEHFRMTGAEIQATMQMTRRTHIHNQVTQQQADNRDLDSKPERWAEGECRHGQMMAVSGPVHVVADDTQRSIPKSDPVFCVSIPGINFAYSTEDATTFIGRGKPNEAAFQRVCRIWHHVLSLFREANVRCPVLCAIGCGAFAGGYSDVPTMYASTGGVHARTPPP